MKLIDATKAMESIDDIVCSMSVCINSDYCNGMRAMKDMTLHAIEEQPTVDAVPVVRCKDCVKRPPATARNGDEPTSDCPLWCGYCFGIDDGHGGEFFCADGERRTNEQ